MKKKMIFFFIATGFLIFLDQITKIIAVNLLAKGPVTIIDGFLKMYYLENRGAAWGMMQGAGIFFVFLTIAITIAVIYLLIKVPAKKRYYPIIAFSILMVAGGIGNLIDRIYLGYVRDFIYIYAINFPIFNVADMCVTAGITVLIVTLIFVYRDEDFKLLRKKKEDRNND